jgi:hypothetical protein
MRVGVGLQRATEASSRRGAAALGGIQRLVEALLVDATARSCGARDGVRDERMTSHLGCRSVTELIEETARVSAATAARWQRAAKAVRPAISDMTGELLEADFPSVRTAMIDGVIGVDGILAITGPLAETVPRVSAEARQAAADVVVAEARGEGPDGAARLRRGARDPRADVVDRPRSGRRRAARARGDPQALVRARHADRARRARPRAAAARGGGSAADHLRRARAVGAVRRPVRPRREGRPAALARDR